MLYGTTEISKNNYLWIQEGKKTIHLNFFEKQDISCKTQDCQTSHEDYQSFQGRFLFLILMIKEENRYVVYDKLHLFHKVCIIQGSFNLQSCSTHVYKEYFIRH